MLLTSKDHYVIDEFEVSYLTTGRDAVRFTMHPTPAAAPPVVVAAPEFNLGALTASGTERFRSLSGALAEGEHIANLLHVSPITGAEAVEQRIKQLRSPHIFHIATHGFFLQDIMQTEPHQQVALLTSFGTKTDPLTSISRIANPLLRSGLALAGANAWLGGAELPPEAEDGLLTAEDVTGMDLRHTELTVLSACETGLGEAHFGEGVLGLRRAFVIAGSKTLVMSLWKVPDEQTSEMMIDFYRRLLDGASRTEALRQSQLSMRKRYPTPFYWGAFICQGEPGQLIGVRHHVRDAGLDAK